METTGAQDTVGKGLDFNNTFKREHELDDFEHVNPDNSSDTLFSTDDIKSSVSTAVSDLSSEEIKSSIDLDPVKKEVRDTISATKDLLSDLTAEYTKAEKNPETVKPSSDLDSDSFIFNKPLPKEPSEEIADFLKAESHEEVKENDHRSYKETDTADFDEPSKFSEDFGPVERDPTPPNFPKDNFDIPPPVPKHQNLHDDSPVDAFEPSQTPEPDYEAMKPFEPIRIEEERKPKAPTPEPMPKPREPTPEPVKPVQEPPKPKSPKTEKEDSSDIGAKDLFCKYGLDAWFNPERLHPRVESLVYWRDPKKSGVVFGVLMVTLLSLAYCSLISVIAYLCLVTLGVTISFRIYKNIMQAVQKTSDGHPFKEWLEVDLAVPEDRVREITGLAVERINRGVSELRRLFLVEDLVDSIKFAVILWAFTYVGAWFNGLTLVIMGVVAMFSLPKVYENNKSQIDSYISVASAKLSEVTNKVKAAVPMGKKDAEKPKDQ